MNPATRTFCLILALFFAPAANAQPEYRAVYVPTFSTNSQSACDSVIANVLDSNINAVFVQIRSRGDAYYYPNREDDTYPNPEPRGQAWSISPSDLDILQYYIDRLHNANPPREVHAWLTTYNSWNSSSAPSSPAHVYNAHRDWLTESESGSTYTWQSDAPLDPGIPAVQDYLYNVFMDIVRNYDIDGIHFDYIRLLSSDSGYDPVARAHYRDETGFTWQSGELQSEMYEMWRRDQVAQLVQRVTEQTRLEKPWVDVSAFLVGFTDSVENLAQGYNWWAANGAIDFLVPSTYSSTVSGNVSRWNDYMDKLGQNGDQNALPMAAGVGSYLFLASEQPDDVSRPEYNTQTVAQLDANARPPDGYVFFAYSALFGSLGGQMAADLFDSGGRMDDWVDVPPMPHKPNEESVPPNVPANVSVALAGGVPRVTFSRPAAAGDGDLPVHYRLYRSSSTAVPLHYENMIMEWWDLDSTRTSFTLDDTEAVGTVWYRVVAYDDWNNRAVSTPVGPVQAASTSIVIECRTPSGALNSNGYSESGGMTDSSVKSTASSPSLSGQGSRFSTSASLTSSYTWRPTITQAGSYDIYVTTPNYSSINAANSQYTIVYQGGQLSGTFALTAANTGNKWTLLASNVPFTAGTSGSVTFSENAPQGDRFYSDAIWFQFAGSGGEPLVKETKPPVHAPVSSVTEVIVDSHPTSLAYDDAGGSGLWADTSFGAVYDGLARYYNSSNQWPLRSYGMWVVDLPQSGRWAIDGWIRNNNDFNTAAQYRFVDSSGAVRSITTTQRSGGGSYTQGDWHINVDGVSDANAYHFDEGRVYVTLYGGAANIFLVADALRFRLVEADAAPSAWMVE